MPTPGGTSPVGTKGIRYIAMKYGPYGQPEHYKTYQVMFSLTIPPPPHVKFVIWVSYIPLSVIFI